MSRRFDESLKQFKKTLALDHSFAAAHLWGSFCYLQKGRHDEFIKEYKEYLAKDPDTRTFVPVIDDILIKSGIEGFMTWLVDVGVKLNKGVYNQPYLLAVFHAMERNIEQAIRWLDEACDKRASWTAWLKVDPGLDNLRNDQRFKVQLEKQRLS
jgi:tetratricopeptide (TPR) repeat protein